MSDDHFLCGTIYWPLLPLGILKSELVPLLSSKDLKKENMIICPFICDSKCVHSDNGRSPCLINSNNKEKCCYYDYHRLFLLIGNGEEFPKCVEYKEEIDASATNYKTLYGSDISVDMFSKSLCFFPQYEIEDDELKGLEFIKEGLSDDVFFGCHDGDCKNMPKVYALALKNLKPRASFYAKSEHILAEAMEISSISTSAFNKLINISAVQNKLPMDEFSASKSGNGKIGDPVYPVVLSFFADNSPDVLLSLIIKDEGDDTKRLIEQALGSIHNEIYMQRQEFLEQWCMNLGERVERICQKNIYIFSDEDTPNYISDETERQKRAIILAMQFAFEAILTIALILAAPKNEIFKGLKYPPFDFDPDNDQKGQISTHIENKIIPQLGINSVDRHNYINNFCEKAEMYANEFVSSEGKLKGRLSAPTVRDLKKIAHTSDPFNARILIRGEPGGGKGATAEDFHFYCMKRIAEPINKNVKNYIEKVKDRLKTIFQLPANYNTSTAGASANLFFRQISNTGWWLWNQNLKNPAFQKKIGVLLKTQKSVMKKINIPTESSFFEDDQKVSENSLIKAFSGLLEKKISLEIKAGKPDFSFNFLQVNCGILGGENSELAEAIERLFGKAGDHEKAMPGLFQTCSYMGGTLFLDEIADAPVRVQDNLLRPLEEETVSRPSWETFDEKVDNIRIVGATFKNLFKLAQQYQETLPSGNPKGFRPDLLTRLTRNTPVYVTPIWHYFVPPKPIDIEDFSNQFAFVLNSSWLVSTKFWHEVYRKVSKQIDEHCEKARYHIPGEHEGRRKFASKITMRLFKAVGKIARLNTKDGEKPIDKHPQKIKALEYLGRMLDYLLVETN